MLRVWLLCVVVWLSFIAMPSFAATCQSGETGGLVFRDVDADGVQDSIEPAIAASGLVVKAYDTAGSEIASASVDSAGAYSLGTIASATLAAGVRLELSGLPSYVKQGAVGTSSASSVRFITTAGCSNLFGLHNPAEYCEADPTLSIACYQGGAAASSSSPAVISTGYSTSGLPIAYGGTATNPTPDTTVGTVGSVWGGAWDARRKRLFLGAFMKRHVGLGPRGLGGIYVLDYSASTVSLGTSFTLSGVTPANGGAAVDLGSVTRTEVAGAISGDFDLSTNPAQPSIDLDAFAKVGAVGYGDLSLSEDGATLWMVNLAQRALMSMDVSGTTASLPGTVRQYLLSDLSGVPTCTGGTFRPFAVEFRDGVGYLGGVCDAQTSQSAANLSAHVLSFSPGSPTSGFTSQISFALNYTREPIWSTTPGATASGSAVFGAWRPWHTSNWVASLTPYLAESAGLGAAQPMLSNIRFLPNGSMVLAFADRYSHQMGYQNYYPISASVSTIEGMSGGDLLLVCRVNGSWVLEGAAGCAETDTDSIVTSDGPNGVGEFFRHDGFYFTGGNFSNLSTHSEIALGGIAVVPSSGEVLAVTFDPLPNTALVRTNGLSRFSAADGSVLANYLIVPDPVSFPGYLGKAGGLGEPLLRCTANPIEIGNRLWLDADSDGVQDSGETPLSGVTVQLCSSTGSVLATATTDANGNYLFSSRSATSTTSAIYSISSLAPAVTGLRVCIPLSQAALSSYLVTEQDGDSTTNGDARDSDCTSSSGSAVISVSLGDVGSNDHTFDCGFTTGDCRESLEADAASIDGSVAALRATLTQVVNLRSRYGALGVCERLASSERSRLLEEGEDNYQSAWTLVWGSLPNSEDADCERTGVSCETVSTVSTKAAIEAAALEIRRSARTLLRSSCMSTRTSLTLRQRRRALLRALSAHWSALEEQLEGYADSVLQCS